MSTLPERLRRYSEACVAERLDPDFAAAVREAAATLEMPCPLRSRNVHDRGDDSYCVKLQRECHSAEPDTTTVMLNQDAISLLRWHPDVLNTFASRFWEVLGHKLEESVLNGDLTKRRNNP